MAEKALLMYSQVKDIVIDETTSCIDVEAFADTDIKSVSLPANLEKIYIFAFKSCKELKSVTFSENSKLNSIKLGVFWGCSSLENIKIPQSTQAVYESAFAKCTALKSVWISNNPLPCVFHDSPNVVILKYNTQNDNLEN